MKNIGRFVDYEISKIFWVVLDYDMIPRRGMEKFELSKIGNEFSEF